MKGLTGSDEGVDKAKRPKINPATPQTCTKNRTVCHYYTTTGPPCHCEQCKQDYRQDSREIIEEYKEKRRIATYVLASRETEEALSEAEAEAKAEECETEETIKTTTEADKEAAKRAAEEDKLDAYYWASFTKPPELSGRNDPGKDGPSINFVENCVTRPTTMPMSAHDRLVAEYIAAKQRLNNPVAPETYWCPQKAAPPAQTTPESTANKTEAILAGKTENIEVKHRADKDNSNADGLSRLQYDENRSMDNNAPTEMATAMMLQLVADEIVPEEEEISVDVETIIESEKAGGLQICRVCQHHHPTEELIRRKEWQHSFHRISCVTPAVYDDIENWKCGECGGPMHIGSTKTINNDMAEDGATLAYLQNERLPAEADRKEQNRIRNRAKNFVYKNGKLYKQKDNAFDDRPVPAISERLGIVQRFHAIGHPGIDRLRKLVNQQYYWPGIGDMATSSVRENCANCQKVSLDAVVPQTLKPIPVYGVLQRWHLDLIGPFPTTTHGKKYGIVAIDGVSKWTEAGALPHKTADNVKRWFWRNKVCRYGTPQEIVTDNGGEFKGEFGALLQRCDITQHFTSPHHPQANGLVESDNQELTCAGSQQCQKQLGRKDPSGAAGHPRLTTSNNKTGPAEILLGHKIRLPVVAEAMVQEETLMDNATPEERVTQQHALMARQQHMEEVEEVAPRANSTAPPCS